MILAQGKTAGAAALGYYLIVLTGLRLGSLRSHRRTPVLSCAGPITFKCDEERFRKFQNEECRMLARRRHRGGVFWHSSFFILHSAFA